MKSFLPHVSALAAVSLVALSVPAWADHSWATYHWKKGAEELAVPVGDNVSSKWDDYLRWAMNGGPRFDGSAGEGWNASTKIEGGVVSGSTRPKNCKAVSGTIQVCSERYGYNGWLGVAQIWISDGHIVQGITKVNDSYFDSRTYNKPEWRKLVMCQEIGHDYGLGHTDEIFDNPNDGTCMDYTNAPAGGVVNGVNYGPSNEYINQHDKDQLDAIYNHSESTSNFVVREFGRAVPNNRFGDDGIGGDSPASWGRIVDRDAEGRPHLYELDFGDGKKRITHVFWAIGEGPRR